MESEIEKQNPRNYFSLQTTVQRHQKHEAPYKMTASAFEEFKLTFIVFVFLFFFFYHCGQSLDNLARKQDWTQLNIKRLNCDTPKPC